MKVQYIGEIESFYEDIKQYSDLCEFCNCKKKYVINSFITEINLVGN